MRLIDSCITPLQAQEPSGTCNESKEEEKKKVSPDASLSASVNLPNGRGRAVC